MRERYREARERERERGREGELLRSGDGARGRSARLPEPNAQ